MKSLLVFLLLCTQVLFAQHYTVLTLDTLNCKTTELRMSGYTLNDNWKFHSGDSMQWSQPGYNDAHWETRSTRFMADTLHNGEFPGIGWFRMKIKIDSTLYNRSIAIGVWHLGASQFFLNGNFVKAYGKPGATPDREIFAQPIYTPMIIVFSADSIQTLALRFSNVYLKTIPRFFWNTLQTNGVLLAAAEANTGVTMKMQQIHENFATQGILVGILFALGLSHLLIYFFYARNRLSLYFGLFALSLSAMIYLGYLMVLTQSVLGFYVTAISQLVALPGMFLFFVLFLFTIRFAKMPRRGYAYMVLSGIIALVAIFYFRVTLINNLLAIFVLFASVEAIISFVGMIREKKEGIGILLAGASGFIFLLMFSFVISWIGLPKQFPGWLIEILVYGGFCSLPFSMSLYLARSYSKTNITLENKLIEVQQLSEAAIEQERNAGELKLQKEMESARAIEAELRAQTAELQARASELQAQALQTQHQHTVKELEDARKLQLSMLPAKIPVVPGFELDVFMKTAAEVGGDYYDFITNQSGELVFAVGDAAGHGVKAGIMVTAAKSFFSGLGSSMPPVAFMEFTSKAIKEMKLSPLYMCMLLGRLQGRTLTYVSAGMPQVLHFRAADNTVQVHETKSVPLGTVFQVSYSENRITLQTGDVLLILTDGFVEMFNEAKEMFGLEQVVALFQANAAKTPTELIAALSEQIQIFTGREQPDDDVTFLVIKAV